MTHQPAGEADNSDGCLGRLRNIKQVVEQRLVLVVGEQVELVQDEQDRAAAAAIPFFQGVQQESQVFRKASLKSDRNLFPRPFPCRNSSWRPLPLLTNTRSPTAFSRWSCRVISFSAILSSVWRRPGKIRRKSA